jgi:hypothetical protein
MAELDFSSLEGAALLYEDSAVTRLNDMMKQVYPNLKAGDAVPPELLHAHQPEVAGALVPIGDAWLALVMPAQCREGAALRLRLNPVRTERMANAHLEFAVRNFIQQLSAGKDAMIDTGLAEENPEVAQYLTGVNYQLCRLQKALDQCEAPANEKRSALLRPVVDFSALFEQVCLEIEGLQAQLDVSFSREISGAGRSRPIFVRGDKAVLEKCLLYLFHQGVKLAKRDSTQHRISLRLTEERRQVRVTLSGSWGVVDRAYLFDHENQMVREEGLHVAQQLLFDSGGALLHVVRGESTVFHLTLPAANMSAGRIFSPHIMIDRPSDYAASLVILSDLLPEEVYSPLLID